MSREENRRDGGAGFLGLCGGRSSGEEGVISVHPRSSEYNLVEMDSVRRLYADTRPDIVIHLSATVGV